VGIKSRTLCFKNTMCSNRNQPIRFLVSAAVISATDKQFFSQRRLASSTEIIIPKCIKHKTRFCFLFLQAKVATSCKDNFAFEMAYNQNPIAWLLVEKFYVLWSSLLIPKCCWLWHLLSRSTEEPDLACVWSTDCIRVQTP